MEQSGDRVKAVWRSPYRVSSLTRNFRAAQSHAPAADDENTPCSPSECQTPQAVAEHAVMKPVDQLAEELMNVVVSYILHPSHPS